jgi:hypothetical protein
MKLTHNRQIIELKSKGDGKSHKKTKSASKKTKEPGGSKKHGHGSSKSSKQTKSKESNKRSRTDDIDANDERPPKKLKTAGNVNSQKSRKTITQQPTTKKKGTAISVPGEVSKRAIPPVPPINGELTQLLDDGTSSESAESSEEEEEEEEVGDTDDGESD